jgi:hypothetical protein
MENPVLSQSPWADPVGSGVRFAGIANGGNDGTAEWGEDGCRRLSCDKGSISEPPPVPANEQ